jgi:regulator of replication initiation timing
MDEKSTIKILKDQIAQMTSATYSHYKRIAELVEENEYLRKRVNYLDNKLEQISDRKLNES